jgi:ribonuclease D
MGNEEKPVERIEPVVEDLPLVDGALETEVKDLSDREIPEEEIIELFDEIPGDTEDIVVAEGVGEQVLREDDKIYDLVYTIEDTPQDEMAKEISEVAEKIAREIVPEIAERVIREEIEKLKSGE